MHRSETPKSIEETKMKKYSFTFKIYLFSNSKYSIKRKHQNVGLKKRWIKKNIKRWSFLTLDEEYNSKSGKTHITRDNQPISSHFPALVHRQIGGSTTLYRPPPTTPPGGTLILYVWNACLSWISGYIPFCNFLNNVFRAPSRESFLVLGQSGVWGTWGVESA